MEIIPGLPDDLGLQCLVKVPYKSHKQLRAVSKSWSAVLNSSHFYKERQRHNECEEGIASVYRPADNSGDVEVIIYYPLENWWERLPEIPKEFELQYTMYHSCHCVYVRSKQCLVVVGLVNKCFHEAPVLMFDFLSRSWSLGPDMQFSHRFYASAVSTSPQGLVYIVVYPQRRLNEDHIPRSLGAYFLDLNKKDWRILPRTIPDDRPQNCSVGAFVDDKFYVIPSNGKSAQVYDPQTGRWKKIYDDNNGQYVENCVSAFGLLYWFCTESESVIVKEFDVANNSFTTVGQYPVGHYPVDCAVLWRDCFFISVRESMDIVYYLFSVREREEERRWTRIDMPAEFPIRCLIEAFAAGVQI